MFLTPTAVFDNHDNSIMTDTSSTFNFNETGKLSLVNSSFCHIASLEVYRGKEQAFNISYDGFSLSDNGTIKVRQL